LKTKKQIPDFLCIGAKLLDWYFYNARKLPFRDTKSPYLIWISEIIFQQTKIEQGLAYYSKFILRFPDVFVLANSDIEEVLKNWEGLGYYSRAINLHKSAKCIVEKYNGVFPNSYADIIALPGVGKYTAAAICSICFDKPQPAVDGNFYRILSRLFADNFDVSQSSAFVYFSKLAEKIMPIDSPGNFNQSMMDFGSLVCKAKNPTCEICPLHSHCIAFSLGKVADFPYKSKRIKIQTENLHYYFIHHKDAIIIQQRDDKGIWKKLFEFPKSLPQYFERFKAKEEIVTHLLTHKKLTIHFHQVEIENYSDFVNYNTEIKGVLMLFSEIKKYAFPKPLLNYLNSWTKGL
jgi:A/G-specific adenine glycosylase